MYTNPNPNLTPQCRARKYGWTDGRTTDNGPWHKFAGLRPVELKNWMDREMDGQPARQVDSNISPQFIITTLQPVFSVRVSENPGCLNAFPNDKFLDWSKLWQKNW